MKKLNSIIISTSEQVEEMRCIYNENLDMLATRPLKPNTYEEQQQWWVNNKHRLDAFLYEELENRGVYIGFAVLTNRGLFSTPIIALKKGYWGRGLGTEIAMDYLEKANRPLAGTQLRSNLAICHINKKLGWQIIGERMSENGLVDLLFYVGTKTDRTNLSEVLENVKQYHTTNK